jgi:SAM-dependent methyltransferase
VFSRRSLKWRWENDPLFRRPQMSEDVDAEPIAKRAYASFAQRYSDQAPTKPHNGLYERPASMALLGDVHGLQVLDAGCGPGICSELMARSGATVHGFDVVSEMVDLARVRCHGLSAKFQVGDLAKPFDWMADASVDRVLCSLALDYIEDLWPVFREFRRVTRPGGKLVFSMSHPMTMWAHEPTRGDDPYFHTHRFGLHWSGFGEPRPFVEAYRRPLQDIFNGLLDAGWTLERVLEPKPVPEMQAVSPTLYERLSHCPEFLCIRAGC